MGQEEATHRMNGTRIRIETAISATTWGLKSPYREPASKYDDGEQAL